MDKSGMSDINAVTPEALEWARERLLDEMTRHGQTWLELRNSKALLAAERDRLLDEMMRHAGTWLELQRVKKQLAAARKALDPEQSTPSGTPR